jgi:signal transduction histidine kinase
MDPAARAQKLARLLDLSTRIGCQLELNALLQTVVDTARQFIHADLCGLLVLSETDPRQFSGIWVSGWHSPPRHYPTGSGVFNLPLITGKPLRVDHVPSHPHSVGTPDGHPPIGPFLGVPLSVTGRIIGTLFVANLIGGTPFTDDDEEMLVAFAAPAAVAIQNSRLYTQVEELAILRERERMAINLHDTVAQIFFSIGLEVDNLQQVIPEGPARERLAYIRSLVATGTDRVREAIGSLYTRGGTPEGANLHRELLGMADEFQKEHGLQVGLIVTGPVDEIPPRVAEVFARATREGLTNIRKHARASMAVISLVVQGQEATLTIQDNGQGLRPGVLAEAPHLQRFGLIAIRRQIERLGGTLELANADEGGALLRLSAPLGARSPEPAATGGGRP